MEDELPMIGLSTHLLNDIFQIKQRIITTKLLQQRRTLQVGGKLNHIISLSITMNGCGITTEPTKDIFIIGT